MASWNLKHIFLKKRLFYIMLITLTLPGHPACANTCNFLKTIRSIFGNENPSKSEYVWPKGELSDAQWTVLQKLLRREKAIPRPGSSILILPSDRFGLGATVESKIGPQHVTMNGEYENRILEKSKIDTSPIEILNIRLHFTNGHIQETPIWVTGNVNTVSFGNAQAQLFSYLKGDLSGVEIIEVVHSHPSYEVVTVEGNDLGIRTGEVSRPDLQVSAIFAQRIPAGKQVIVRAVVPNGYNYAVSLHTGR